MKQVILGAVVTLLLSVSAYAQTVDLSKLPLLTQKDVVEVAGWTVPDTDGAGFDEKHQFNYTQRGLMAVDDVRGWFSCHDWYSMAAEITLPALGGKATVTKPCAPIQNLQAINPGDPNSKKLGGALWYNNRLITSAFAYYDAQASQSASHFAGVDMASQAGPVRVGANLKPGMVGGYMGLIPQEWRAALGGPAFTGKCCTAVISRSSGGPTLTVFNPDDVGKANPVTAKMLVGYPAEHPTLGWWGSVNNTYGSTDDVGNAAFVAGTRSVLFFGRHGKTHCYGSGTNDPNLHGKPDGMGNVWCYDPVDGSKGTHGFPYTYRIWAYDALDLAAVNAGTKNHWDVLPYGVWDMPTPVGGGAFVAGMAYDPATKRMHVSGGGLNLKTYQITVPSVPPPTSTVTVDPTNLFETSRGWEVQNEAWKERSDYQAFRQAAVDKVAEAGINRIRFEVRAGSENVYDSYAAFKAAGYPTSGAENTTWRARRYETVNDNSDPNVINPTGFNWTEIDDVADNLVNPLRAKLAAKGEQLYVNFNYVAFLAQVTSGVPYAHNAPEEYAEFMLAAFQHLQTKYGWVPDAIEIILEPDNVQPTWTGTKIGQVAAATGARLAAAGYHPDFIAPATTAMDRAVPYFDAAIAVPGAAQYIKELSYHRYAGVSTANLQAIAAKGMSANVGTAMLEMWDPFLSYHTLHEDLKIGKNAAWQQAAFVNLNTIGGIGISYINPATPTVAQFTNLTKFTSLYYRWVRMGARRIAAPSDQPGIDALAWKNVNGLVTVVAKADGGATFTVGGLPAGTYGISYALQFTNVEGTLPDQTIAAGQSVNVTMPSSGVVAVYGKSTTVQECTLSDWVLDSFTLGQCNAAGVQTRTELWKRTIVSNPDNQVCGPLEETRNTTQACTPPPVQTASASIKTKTCTLTVNADIPPPGGLTGWGVQFYRRLEGTTTWQSHGGRDTSAPYTRDADVALGRWEAQAIWSRNSVPEPPIPVPAVQVCEP